MKVALLTDCYLPRLGGIEVQVHDLARNLQAAGHHVEAFTATPGPAHQRSGTDVIDGIKVHRLAITLPGDFPINPLAPPALRRMLVAGGFDVAHAHLGVISPFSMDCVRVSLGLGMPTAVTWHSVHARVAYTVKAMGYVARWARRGAALSAVSGVAAAPIHDLAGTQYPVAILPNGIDITNWQPQPRTADGPVRIVSAMRLQGRKRPLQLLDIVHEVRRRLPEQDIRLEVLGEGPLRPRLEKAARELHAEDWFTAPGRMTREQLLGHYLASDIYVAPAELEAFGIAALEARTTGLPVVAPRRSGVSEFITDGVNGLLGANDEELIEAIAALAADSRLRLEMTEYNRQHSPKESWPSVVQMAEREYERAIGLQQLTPMEQVTSL